jgi:hypothetical protein
MNIYVLTAKGCGIKTGALKVKRLKKEPSNIGKK